MRATLTAKDPRSAAAFLAAHRISPGAAQARALAKAAAQLPAEQLDDPVWSAWLAPFVEAEPDVGAVCEVLSVIRAALPDPRRTVTLEWADQAFERRSDARARQQILATVQGWAVAEKNRAILAALVERHRVPLSLQQVAALTAIPRRDTADLRVGPWIAFYFASVVQGHWHHAGFLTNLMQSLDGDETQALLDAIASAVPLTADTERRMLIGHWFITLASMKNDSGRIFRFLEEHAGFFPENRPEPAAWRVRGEIAAGNPENARTAIRQLASGFPAFAKTDSFRHLETAVFTMRAAEQSPAAEEQEDGRFLQELVAAIHEARTNDLDRLIRDELLAKADAAVVHPDDPRLFRGAKTRIRETVRSRLDPAAYHARTALYTEALVKRAGYSKAEAAQYARTVSLAGPDKPSPPAPASLRARDLAQATGATQFMPLVDLPAGVLELRARQSQMGIGGPNVECFSLPVAEGAAVFIQTSRAIACLRGDAVAWSRAAPVGTVWDTPHVPRHFGAVREPAIAGRLVVGRFIAGESPVLAAFDRETGDFAWVYRPAGARINGDPVFWKGLLLAQGLLTGHTGGATVLLMVDADTGRENGRYRLAGEPREVALAYPDGNTSAYVHVRYAENMPPPVVAGSVAYLQPLAGAIAAFDLLDRSLIWLRLYPRVQHRDQAAPRRDTLPIVGQDNLLVTAPDARDMLLLDRATGRVVAQDSSTQWHDACPAGPNTAAILSRGHVHFRSLKDLSVLAEAPLPGATVLQPLADGCALYDSASNYVYNAAGSRVAAWPRTARALPLRFAAGRLFAFDRTRPDRIGAMTPTAPPPGATPPAVTAPAIARPNTLEQGRNEEPDPVRAAAGDFAVVNYRDFLTCFTTGGRRAWDRPVARGTPVCQLGNTVALLQSGRIDFFNMADGAWLRSWPPFERSSVLQAHSLYRSGDRLIARVTDRTRTPARAMIYSVSDEGRRGEPVALDQHGWKPYAAGNGDFFFNYWWEYWVQIYSMNPTADREPDPVKRGYSFQELRAGSPYRLVADPSEGKVWMLQSPTRQVWQFDRKGRSDPFSVPGTGPLWQPHSTIRAGNGIVSVFTGGDFHFLDFETRRHCSIPRWAHDHRPNWVLADRRIHAFRRESDGRIAGTLVDFSKDGPPRLESSEPIQGRDGWLRAPSVRVGSAVLHPFFLWTWGLPASPGSVGVQAVGRPNLAFKPFPHFTWSRPLSDRLALFNETPVDAAMLETCTNLDRRVRRAPCRAAAPEFVDGFLDDWAAREFAAFPRGRLAVRCGRGPAVGHWSNFVDWHWLAVEVSDPSLVRRMIRRGAGLELDLILANGSKAGFLQDSEGERRSYSHILTRSYHGDIGQLTIRRALRLGKNDPDTLFACSVTPDGKLLRIELAVRDRRLLRLRPPKEQPSTAELFYGDVALRLLWRESPWDAPVNLLEEAPAGPLAFARAALDHEP